jgi:putative ATPase
MESLPEGLRGRRYYEPTERGAEAEINARLEAARRVRNKKTSNS